MIKKVELIEQNLEKVDKMEKSVNAMMEILKKKPIKIQCMEEEIVYESVYLPELIIKIHL